MKKNKSYLSVVDGYIRICEEKILGNGEDADWFSINETAAMVSVFDGAGGSGAKRYSRLENKTGAFLGSRALAGATKNWFTQICEEKLLQSSEVNDLLKMLFIRALDTCKREGGEQVSGVKLKSSLSKDFPSTAAIAVCSPRKNWTTASFYWAGDSRGYILDKDGLAQITKDDLEDIDAMENLSADGVMTNIVTSSKDFMIHDKTVKLTEPSIVFTATDGCFGYLSTPMEFEYVLLETLLNADSLFEWQSTLADKLGQYAGDDYTLDAVIIGYGSFANLKNAFINRANYIYEYYIKILPELSSVEKTSLWQSYKDNYYRFE